MAVSAAKIEKDEIDEFTGLRTVITSWQSFDKKEMNIRFRLQNGKLFMDYKFISGQVYVIPDDSSILFKCISGDILTLRSVGMSQGGPGVGSVNILGAAAWGVSTTYTGDLTWFCSFIPSLVRINTTDGYIDRKISDKEGQKIYDLAMLFFDTIGPQEQ